MLREVEIGPPGGDGRFYATSKGPLATVRTPCDEEVFATHSWCKYFSALRCVCMCVRCGNVLARVGPH